MLVLTRHTNQKVLFPNLGISIQVVDTRKGSVRLGIDAPPEIRIVRDELLPLDRPVPASKASPLAVPSCENSEQFRRHLDAANLAIHLAQNQLKQGLEDNANEAMEQALASLQALEQSCRNGRSVFDEEVCNMAEPLAVRETANAYAVGSSKNQPLNVACLDKTATLDHAELNELIGQRIEQTAQCELVLNELQLIERVRTAPDLDMVLIPSTEFAYQQSICIPNASSLTQLAKPMALGKLKAMAWISQRVTQLLPAML